MTDTHRMFDLYITALRRFAQINRESAARYRLTEASPDADVRLWSGVQVARCLARAEQADAKANRLIDAVAS